MESILDELHDRPCPDYNCGYGIGIQTRMFADYNVQYCTLRDWKVRSKLQSYFSANCSDHNGEYLEMGLFSMSQGRMYYFSGHWCA